MNQLSLIAAVLTLLGTANLIALWAIERRLGDIHADLVELAATTASRSSGGNLQEPPPGQRLECSLERTRSMRLAVLRPSIVRHP